MGLKGCGVRIAVLGAKLWITKTPEFFHHYLYEYE